MSKPNRVEPLPGDPLGRRLSQTFSYPWKAIVKTNDPDSNWKTLNEYPLRPRELWRLWQDPNQIVGVRFDSITSYGMIDLDAKGAYHPAQDAQALSVIRAALETIGITRTFLTQSSSSGGLHLWLPLPEQIPTFRLAATIRQCLEVQGLTVEQGQLEIFPNCKAYAREGQFTEYQGHRLPLQPATGAQLLDDDLNLIAGGLERFFEIWDQCAIGQDTEQLRQAIAQTQKNWRKRSLRRDSATVESWRTALELEVSEGWTGYGQTNHLLKQIACYGVVFQGLKGKNLIEYIQRTATSSPGYTQWCRHQHEIALRCSVWARAAEDYYWAFGTERKRQGNIHKEGADAIVSINCVNQARAENAQSRITNAFNQLKEAGQLALYKTKTALENTIIKLAQCSKKTTRKYMHLWYPEAGDVFEKVCTNDNERVSVLSELTPADLQESLKPSPNKEVHTESYMKGLALVADFGSDPPQILPLRGDAGGISTATASQAELIIPVAPNCCVDAPCDTSFSSGSSVSQHPQLVYQASKQQGTRRRIKSSSDYVDEETRVAIGRAMKRLGWKVEELKQFTIEQIGKTIHTLTSEDGNLLLYRLQNLISPP